MLFTPPTPYSTDLWSGRTVGLLGGSFNPAHDGHRHISLEAIKALKLDAVWWMVSPQNPMKPTTGMAPFDRRLSQARKVAQHPRIIATDIEQQMGTRYTIDTLTQLKKKFTATHFVWLMGNDNLMHFHQWHDWEEIFRLVPICVLDRPPRSNIVRNCKVTESHRQYLVDPSLAAQMPDFALPVWTILHIPLSDWSSTAIRSGEVDYPYKES